MDEFTLVRIIPVSDVMKNIVGEVEVYKNSTYNVSKSRKVLGDSSEIIHLVICRHDNQPLCGWADKQFIKNQIVGPEYTGVEVFPPESNLTDAANCYHIWVYPDPAFRLPFTLNVSRTVVPK